MFPTYTGRDGHGHSPRQSLSRGMCAAAQLGGGRGRRAGSGEWPGAAGQGPGREWAGRMGEVATLWHMEALPGRWRGGCLFVRGGRPPAVAATVGAQQQSVSTLPERPLSGAARQRAEQAPGRPWCGLAPHLQVVELSRLAHAVGVHGARLSAQPVASCAALGCVVEV